MSGCHSNIKCSCTCHSTLYGHPEYCTLCECNWENMVNGIEIASEKYNRHLWISRNTEILKRIEKLETHKNYQIDENRKSSRRVDEIEERNKEYLNKLAELSVKINKIRSECHVAFEIKNEKPHKCPVCEGDGGTIISGIIDELCRACEGTGILWR